MVTVPVVADVIYTRSQILATLDSLGLTKAWLASQIKESKQAVHKWLHPTDWSEPQDPTVWQRMTDVLERMVSGPSRPEAISPEVRQWSVDLSIAVLMGDDESAKAIAPQILRELTRTYSDSESRKKREK